MVRSVMAATVDEESVHLDVPRRAIGRAGSCIWTCRHVQLDVPARAFGRAATCNWTCRVVHLGAPGTSNSTLPARPSPHPPAISSSGMDFDLADEHRRSATRCASSPRARSRRWPRSSTARGASPTRSSRRPGELGLLGMPIAEEYGGAGPTRSPTRSRSRSWPGSTRSFAITVAAHTSLGTRRSTSSATTAQQQRWLPRARLGRGARLRSG